MTKENKNYREAESVYAAVLVVCNLMIFALTAADGAGIRNVRLSLTNGNGTIRWAQTSSFGYYRFDEIEVGQTTILQVFGKQFVFANPMRILNVQEEIADADFTAEPRLF